LKQTYDFLFSGNRIVAKIRCIIYEVLDLHRFQRVAWPPRFLKFIDRSHETSYTSLTPTSPSKNWLIS